MEDYNAAPIRPQRYRSLHVIGISNDLYRDKLSNTRKQGFNFNPDLYASLKAQVFIYGLPSSLKSIYFILY
jgi:hypothetical protein